MLGRLRTTALEVHYYSNTFLCLAFEGSSIQAWSALHTSALGETSETPSQELLVSVETTKLSWLLSAFYLLSLPPRLNWNKPQDVRCSLPPCHSQKPSMTDSHFQVTHASEPQACGAFLLHRRDEWMLHECISGRHGAAGRQLKPVQLMMVLRWAVSLACDQQPEVRLEALGCFGVFPTVFSLSPSPVLHSGKADCTPSHPHTQG